MDCSTDRIRLLEEEALVRDVEAAADVAGLPVADVLDALESPVGAEGGLVEIADRLGQMDADELRAAWLALELTRAGRQLERRCALSLEDELALAQRVRAERA